MNYPDGSKIMVGDRVKLWEGCHGTVVCSIDDDKYTPEYRKADWFLLEERGIGQLRPSGADSLHPVGEFVRADWAQT